MYTIDEVHEILDELYEEVPEGLKKGLNGGVVLRDEVKYHPEAEGTELVVLGTYSNRKGLGRFITIYYGSFMELYSNLSREALKDKLRDTLFHEFTHHVESLAGVRDLEIKDEIKIKKYRGEL